MADKKQEQQKSEGSATEEGDEPMAEGSEAQDEPVGAAGEVTGDAESEGGEGEQGSRLKRTAVGAAAGAAIGGAVAAAAGALSNRGTEGIKEGASHAGEKVKEMGKTVKEKLPGGSSEEDAGGEADTPEKTPAA